MKTPATFPSARRLSWACNEGSRLSGVREGGNRGGGGRCRTRTGFVFAGGERSDFSPFPERRRLEPAELRLQSPALRVGARRGGKGEAGKASRAGSSWGAKRGERSACYLTRALANARDQNSAEAVDSPTLRSTTITEVVATWY